MWVSVYRHTRDVTDLMGGAAHGDPQVVENPVGVGHALSGPAECVRAIDMGGVQRAADIPRDKQGPVTGRVDLQCFKVEVDCGGVGIDCPSSAEGPQLLIASVGMNRALPTLFAVEGLGEFEFSLLNDKVGVADAGRGCLLEGQEAAVNERQEALAQGLTEQG